MVAKYLSTKVFINHRGKKRSFTTEKAGRHRPGQRMKGKVSSTGTNEAAHSLTGCTENRAWLLRVCPAPELPLEAAPRTEPPPPSQTPRGRCRHSLSHVRAGGMMTGSTVQGPRVQRRAAVSGLGKHSGQHSQPAILSHHPSLPQNRYRGVTAARS